METTDKTTEKSPLFKMTRAQLIKMIEELKANSNEEELKKEYAKLNAEKDNAYAKIKSLETKCNNLKIALQTMNDKEEYYKIESKADTDEIAKLYAVKNLWKMWTMIFSISTAVLVFYILHIWG